MTGSVHAFERSALYRSVGSYGCPGQGDSWRHPFTGEFVDRREVMGLVREPADDVRVFIVAERRRRGKGLWIPSTLAIKRI